MAHAHDSRNFFLEGPAGRLESILWTPTDNAAPPLASLVCHPHPLFGGTMHNKVVYQASKSLASLGVPVLRFNFRGTGSSEGTHDRGQGEQDDVRAALDFLASEFPGVALLLAGFSFGSWVGLRVGCGDGRVSKLIGLGAPVNNADFSYLLTCTKPKLFVQGGNDQFGAMDKLHALVSSLPGDNQVVEVREVNHFFVGKLDELDRAITSWVTNHNPARGTKVNG